MEKVIVDIINPKTGEIEKAIATLNRSKVKTRTGWKFETRIQLHREKRDWELAQ